MNEHIRPARNVNVLPQHTASKVEAWEPKDPVAGIDRRSCRGSGTVRWRIPLCMVLAMAVSAGAISQYTMGLFLTHTGHDFGWNRGVTSSVFSLYFIGSAVSVPLYGYLIDRSGPALPAAISTILFSITLAALSKTTDMVMFVALVPLAGLVSGGTMVIPYVVTITSNYVAHRGLALGIGASGVGLGGVLLPPLVQRLMDVFGWRGALLAIAVIIPFVAIPCAFFGLDRRSRVAAPLRNPPQTVHLWRLKPFWMIAGAVLFVSLGISGVLLHASQLLEDHGFSASRAASLISLTAAAAIIGRVVGGWLMDRMHAPYVAAGFFLLGGSGMLILVARNAPILSILGLAGLGLSVGAEADAVAYLSSQYLRSVGLGGATGLLIFTLTVSGACGVALFGKLFTMTGSYDLALMIVAPLQLIAAGLLIGLGQPCDADHCG